MTTTPLEELKALRPFEPDEILEIEAAKVEQIIAELEACEKKREEVEA